MDIGRVEDGLTIQILSLFCSLPLNLPLPTFAPRKAARRRCRWSASGRAWVLVTASVTSSVFFSFPWQPVSAACVRATVAGGR